jgi:hypothetical protein
VKGNYGRKERMEGSLSYCLRDFREIKWWKEREV